MKRGGVLSILGLAAAVGLGAGCASGPHLAREDQIRLLMDRNQDLSEKLLAAERRVAELAAGGATPAPLPATPEDPYRPVAIHLGRGTGGLDSDGTPGDERLKIVIEPLDAEGDVVKRAGRLVVETFEPGAKGQPPKPFHRWELTARDLAQTWIGSLGIRGYVMKWPWPHGRRPATDTLIVRAAFATLSGEVLTAEAEVRVAKQQHAPVKPGG